MNAWSDVFAKLAAEQLKRRQHRLAIDHLEDLEEVVLVAHVGWLLATYDREIDGGLMIAAEDMTKGRWLVIAL